MNQHESTPHSAGPDRQGTPGQRTRLEQIEKDLRKLKSQVEEISKEIDVLKTVYADELVNLPESIEPHATGEDNKEEREHDPHIMKAPKDPRAAFARVLKKLRKRINFLPGASLRERISQMEEKLDLYEKKANGSGTRGQGQPPEAIALEEALALSNTISWELLGYLELRGSITVTGYLEAFQQAPDAFECMDRLYRIDMITREDQSLVITPRGTATLREYGFIDIEPDFYLDPQ